MLLRKGRDIRSTSNMVRLGKDVTFETKTIPDGGSGRAFCKRTEESEGILRAGMGGRSLECEVLT